MVLSKLSKTSKPRKVHLTTRPFYSVSYTNIRGLRGNLPEVATHALEEKPDLFFMSETLVKTSGKLEKNDLPSLAGYSDPHVKQHGHGLAAYVKEGFPCSRFEKYELHICVSAFLSSTVLPSSLLSTVHRKMEL